MVCSIRCKSHMICAWPIAAMPTRSSAPICHDFRELLISQHKVCLQPYSEEELCAEAFFSCSALCNAVLKLCFLMAMAAICSTSELCPGAATLVVAANDS